jgi:phage portal protein BeeE
VLGEENAGDVVLMNKHMKLTPWQQSNIDNQWHETRQDILGEVGRLFGIPPHLLNDIEKQTSWGTGVAEQNLGLARFTLMGWSSRIEQRCRSGSPRASSSSSTTRACSRARPPRRSPSSSSSSTRV